MLGVFVLFFAPNKYEDFMGSKSKRRAFRKLSAELGVFPKEFVETLDSLLDDFENNFRTPETHGTGVLRKDLFSTAEPNVAYTTSPMQHWNALNGIAHIIGGLFDSSKGEATTS
jgi:hypothetical protein